jgi:hypothetical protein
MENKKEKVMHKLLGCLLFVPIVAIAEPQITTYYDSNGKAFLNSNRVGNQTFYNDVNGKWLATSVPVPVTSNPIATPKVVFPVLPSSASGTVLPSLPSLPSLDLLK